MILHRINIEKMFFQTDMINEVLEGNDTVSLFL